MATSLRALIQERWSHTPSDPVNLFEMVRSGGVHGGLPSSTRLATVAAGPPDADRELVISGGSPVDLKRQKPFVAVEGPDGAIYRIGVVIVDDEPVISVI